MIGALSRTTPCARRGGRNACAVIVALALAGLASCAAVSAPGPEVVTECVPFARAVAELPIYGNAADWWTRAQGRYQRSSAPSVGSVMVFRRTQRLPYGHVAVVSRVLSERRIFLTHANWVPHRVSEDVLTIDVSEKNDWSQVRVWWPPTNQLGASAYPAYGFIQPNRPVQREQITANARRYIVVASRN